MFGIGSFIGKVFGTDKAAASLIDNISSGLDKLHYGAQEKAEDKAASVTEGRTVLLEWLKNTQGQNLARRVIALLVTFMWSLNIMLIQGLTIASVWVSSLPMTMIDGKAVPVISTSAKCIESARLLAETGSTITSAMMLILAFYFAAPQMGKFADVALKKFGGSNGK